MDAQPTAEPSRAEIIRSKTFNILALEAQRKAIGEQIADERLELKGLGLKAAEHRAVVRIYRLEGEERAAAIANMNEIASAIDIQGEMFGGGFTYQATQDDGDAYADTVGPDTARAARGDNGTTKHKYPQNRFAGGATGDVIAGVFGNDAA